jgi:hypothetical protein
MKVGLVLVLFVFTCCFGHGQSRQARPGSSPQGSLTVTATVESSVWLVPTPDGKQELVVANAPDSKQTFYHPPTAKRKEKKLPARLENNAIPTGINKAAFKVTPGGQHGNQNEATVVYSFPAAPKQVEVTQEIRMMDLADVGATSREIVQVITVVAQ